VVTSGIALAVAAAALIGFDAFDVTGSGLWFVDAPYAFAFVLGYMEIGVAVVCRARRIAVSDDRVERAADVWEVHTDADFIVPEQLPVSPDPAQARRSGIGDIPRALDRLNWMRSSGVRSGRSHTASTRGSGRYSLFVPPVWSSSRLSIA